MAFTGRTPESLIPRSDSRNPATTCKGITKSGRPCRRAIDAKALSGDNGVLAVVSVANDSDEEDTGAAAFFCWQHKAQAEHLAAGDAARPSGRDTRLYPLQERNSIDTLVARLGVLDVDEPTKQPRRRRRQSRADDTSGNGPPRRLNRPPTWDHVRGPLMSVPSDLMAESKRPDQGAISRPRQKKPSFWASLCCGSVDDDYIEVVKHKKRVREQDQVPAATATQPVSETPRPQMPQRIYRSRPNGATTLPVSDQLPVSNSVPARKPLGDKAARPLNKTASRPSETSMLLSYIPKSLPPQTTSTLLAELSKPISQHDEGGYIYIFWLTPDAVGPAPSSTASTLLAPTTRPEQGRRTSDVLRQYSVRRPQRPQSGATRHGSGEAASESAKNNTILLKIGRANNVTRRMNEWTRQCGYSLSLVRYYPYVPSTASPSPSPHSSPTHSRHHSYNTTNNNNQRPSDSMRTVSEGVRKVPHAHRVERLIHIELAERRVMRKCDACGKDHREWFEVEATREGVKGVDEVVKRWVDWAERAN